MEAHLALWTHPEAWRYLRRRGLSWWSIHSARLGYVSDLEAIVIPYRDGLGRIRTLRYRSLTDDGRKYWWRENSGIHLYNLRRVGEERIWLAEGEFDTLILEQLGFPSIGVPGATGFQRPWRHLFYYTDVVTIVFDGDEAGAQGAQRTAGMLSSVTGVKIARLPEGYDVTDLYLEDPAYLRRLLV